MRSRVWVRLSGGIGNQLFQVAAALVASRGFPVVLDVGSYNSDSLRRPSVCDLSLPTTVGWDGPSAMPRRLRLARGLARVRERSEFEEDLRLASCGSIGFGAYLEGYWQSYSYVVPNISLFRAALPPLKILPSDYVAVHVRRGDFVESASTKHQVVTKDWIQIGIDRMVSAEPAVPLVVFSDDRPWCQAQLNLPDNALLAPDAVDDFAHLRQMAAAKALLIPNSTYSWWAAALGGMKVEMPSMWLAGTATPKSLALPGARVREVC